MSDTSTASGGAGLFTLLTVLFVGLKLTGYIDWSWLWVFAPIWIPAAFVALTAIIILIGIAIDS